MMWGVVPTQHRLTTFDQLVRISGVTIVVVHPDLPSQATGHAGAQFEAKSVLTIHYHFDDLQVA